MNTTDLLTTIIIGIIVILFFAEILYFYKRNTSIKSTVTIVGVLGTFIGIVIGLWGFDYVNVEKSLPTLLGGLTTAFLTSVAGMVAFLFLTIIEKWREKPSTNSENFVDILSDIREELKNLNGRVENTENKLSEIAKDSKKLDSLKELGEKLYGLKDLANQLGKLEELDKLQNLEKSNNSIVKKLDSLEKLEKSNSDISTKLTKLDSLHNLSKLDNLETLNTKLETSNEALAKLPEITNAITDLKTNQNEQNKTLIESFGKNFEDMNLLLDKTFQKISEGASKDIIEALQQVIQDFNDELTTQFGENFKELNKAVFDLVTWQENYKSSVEAMESNLKTSMDSMEKSKTSLETISARNGEVVETYDKLKETIETYKFQIDEVNRHLTTYAELSEKAKEVFPNIEKSIKDVGSNFQMATSSIQTDLGTLITDIDSAITQNGEKITNTLNTVSTEFENQKTQISETLQQHSETIIKISNELPTQLQDFGDGISAITGEFTKDYNMFLENAKKLMK
ncbi:hypothetical protein ThvES_00007660 [Thiovulum sp. ES]|nr:hypothetical protein ThvES_00007660 [Thiovulum sp. ES]